MELKAGFPYAAVRFDRNGAPVDLSDVSTARQMVRDGHVTDLLVLAHGWNNNMEDAGNLYDHLLTSARGTVDGELAAPLTGRSLGVVGIFWPSMRYTDAALIPGGAASNDPTIDFGPALDQALEVFDDPKSPLHPALLKLKANLAVVGDKGSLQREFLAAVRAQLPKSATADDQIKDTDLQDWPTVKERLAVNVLATTSDETVAAGGIFSSAIQAIRNLLNLTTYYEMKDRASVIGESGALGMLRDLKLDNPALKVHLVGHSFGGRLVSSMARGPDGEAVLPIDSLHLLQAAYSHYGFGTAMPDIPEGYFRPVVTQHRVRGPILVTHTKNDLAVGLAYAAASALAGQVAASIGGPDDLYGAIGSNGALNTDVEKIELTPTSPLHFKPGTIYNLHADFIKDHGDVAQSGVIRAVLYGIAAAPK